MSSSTAVSSTSTAIDAWKSLVKRSIASWKPLFTSDCRLEEEMLQSWSSLDRFLTGTVTPGPLFWFFQTRNAFLSQKTMAKWSPDNLDDYVLLPATSGGFVNRNECFFVSHFWHRPTDPDPGGKYLRLLQNDLQQQEWSFIWVDWTCAPQSPRTEKEDRYFRRTLQTMSGIIRNSGFAWYYPPFEPRLWILYEVAEYRLTSTDSDLIFGLFPDINEFVRHVDEMVEVGVQPTLQKHGYGCSYEGDMEFLTSWLELLVLLKRLDFRVDEVRRLMDYMTWFPVTGVILRPNIRGGVALCRFEGSLTVAGVKHTFTPFPRLASSLQPSGIS